MIDLIQTYKKNPNTLKVNLEMRYISRGCRNLKDMTQMVAILHKFQHLTELSLHCNQLKSIPPLDSLKKLQYLDISKNPIIIDNTFLDRLFQIPKLQDLNIDASPEELTMLIEHLPNLKTINGRIINRLMIKKQKLEEQKKGLHVKLTEQLAKMRELHQRMSKIYMQTQSQEEIFKKQDQFSFIYKDIQEEMVYFYSGLEDQLALEGVFSHCKNKLTVILDNLMIRILDEFGNDHVVKAYQEISKIKSQNFDALLRTIFNMSFQRHISDQMNNEDNKFRKETLYLNQIYRLKKEIVELKKEQTNIERLTARQQEIKRGYENKYSLKTPTSSSRTPRKIKIQGEFPLKKSPSKGYLQSFQKNHFSKENEPKRSPGKLLSKSPSQVLNKSPSKVLNKSPSKVMSKTGSISKLSRVQELKDTSKRVSRSESNKIFTLEQMLSLINEIMMQKRKYNNKNLQKKEPYETTQEFLFSFFSRKYGLKDMALQWSLSTIKSIEKYCKESIEVQVFGKILKNRLYEQYYDEVREFKKFVENTLKKQRIGEIIKQIQFKRLFLSFFSYETKETIDKLIEQTKFPQKTADFASFIQAYKLAFEEKHMKKFIEVFERLDYQGNGFLNQRQCKSLYSELLNDISDQVMDKDQKQKLSQTFKNGLTKLSKDKFIFSQVFQMAHNIL